MSQTNIAQAAAVRMTMRFPFWCELYYSMTVRETTPEESVHIQTEATDGRNLWINRSHFEKLSLDEQVCELVHELSHKMFIHPTRQGHREGMKWNIACDYAINAMMVQNGFKIGSDWLYEPKYTGWLAEAIYADLVKEEREGGQPKQMPGNGKRSDLKKPEGSQEAIDKFEQEIQATVDRAIANAKARGDMPGGIEANLMIAYKAAKEPWYNHLHRYMQSLASSNYNWARLNRRTLKTHGVFSPLHLSEALGEVVLWMDTSGSCFARAQQAKFAEHINAILAEAKPKKVVVYYFDTQCYTPEEFEAGAIEIELRPQGGGGTDFRGLFTRAEADGYSPEVGIVLTDMMGPMPSDAPDYPVIWADTVGYKDAPFGEHIVID